MSRVFSIDSEGIWNACTTKVITKTAITTVPRRDSSELTISVSGADGFVSIAVSIDYLFVTLLIWWARRFFQHCPTRLWARSQICQELAGGILLRRFFRRALCASYKSCLSAAVLCIEPCFNRENLTVL